MNIPYFLFIQFCLFYHYCFNSDLVCGLSYTAGFLMNEISSITKSLNSQILNSNRIHTNHDNDNNHILDATNTIEQQEFHINKDFYSVIDILTKPVLSLLTENQKGFSPPPYLLSQLISAYSRLILSAAAATKATKATTAENRLLSESNMRINEKMKIEEKQLMMHESETLKKENLFPVFISLESSLTISLIDRMLSEQLVCIEGIETIQSIG